MKGKVLGIYISPVAKGIMQPVLEVDAIAGRGLKGDRYCNGQGSYNAKTGVGNRQVTLINALFFHGSGFEWIESRRNLIVEDVELMWLIGKEFQVGAAKFRGVKYCDPCEIPKELARRETSFKEAFLDRGGLVAEVLECGSIKVGDTVIPPIKGY